MARTYYNTSGAGREWSTLVVYQLKPGKDGAAVSFELQEDGRGSRNVILNNAQVEDLATQLFLAVGIELEDVGSTGPALIEGEAFKLPDDGE